MRRQVRRLRLRIKGVDCSGEAKYDKTSDETRWLTSSLRTVSQSSSSAGSTGKWGRVNLWKGFRFLKAKTVSPAETARTGRLASGSG